MTISNDSIQKLLPLLRPYMRDENERRAYLIRALGMDTPVLNRLVLNTPVDVFITIAILNDLQNHTRERCLHYKDSDLDQFCD